MEKLATLNHLHMLGTAKIKKIPNSIEEVNQWMIDLVEKINMHVLLGPYSVDCKTLGNQGITSAIILEESHSSIHFWTAVEHPFSKFDIYSCNLFDVKTVIDHFECFDPSMIEYILIDRNQDSRIIDQGKYFLGEQTTKCSCSF